MSHLDEGTLHALLDGELELSEVSEIQMHLDHVARGAGMWGHDRHVVARELIQQA